MPKDREQSVAGAGERIDYTKNRTWRRGGCYAGDILADALSERIANGLKRCAGQDADAARVPLRRCHVIERNCIRDAETVAPELLDLPQLDDLIALRRTQQEITIITWKVITVHFSAPAQQIPTILTCSTFQSGEYRSTEPFFLRRIRY